MLLLIGNMINDLDQQILIFLADNRSGLKTAIFSAVSCLGNWQFVVLAMLALIIFLVARKKISFIAPLVFTVLGSETITFLGKNYFQRPRPSGAVFSETGFSFPSGHATVAVAFFLFLAFIIVKFNQARKARWVYGLVALLVLAIGFSRLYLGAHYLSDVLAGYLVGASCLLIGIFWIEGLEKEIG